MQCATHFCTAGVQEVEKIAADDIVIVQRCDKGYACCCFAAVQMLGGNDNNNKTDVAF